MRRTKLIALVVLAVVVVGGAVTGAIYLHTYRRHQALEEVSRAAKELTALVLEYRRKDQQITEDMFRQRDVDTASYFGIATQDPDERFDSAKASAALSKWYNANLEQIDTSGCPQDFREAFGSYMLACREVWTATTNDDVDTRLKKRREAGDRLIEVADSYKTFLMLPLGHRNLGDDSSQ